MADPTPTKKRERVSGGDTKESPETKRKRPDTSSDSDDDAPIRVTAPKAVARAAPKAAPKSAPKAAPKVAPTAAPSAVPMAEPRPETPKKESGTGKNKRPNAKRSPQKDEASATKTQKAESGKTEKKKGRRDISEYIAEYRDKSFFRIIHEKKMLGTDEKKYIEPSHHEYATSEAKIAVAAWCATIEPKKRFDPSTIALAEWSELFNRMQTERWKSGKRDRHGLWANSDGVETVANAIIEICSKVTGSKGKPVFTASFEKLMALFDTRIPAAFVERYTTKLKTKKEAAETKEKEATREIKFSPEDQALIDSIKARFKTLSAAGTRLSKQENEFMLGWKESQLQFGAMGMQQYLEAKVMLETFVKEHKSVIDLSVPLDDEEPSTETIVPASKQPSGDVCYYFGTSDGKTTVFGNLGLDPGKIVASGLDSGTRPPPKNVFFGTEASAKIASEMVVALQEIDEKTLTTKKASLFSCVQWSLVRPEDASERMLLLNGRRSVIFSLREYAVSFQFSSDRAVLNYALAVLANWIRRFPSSVPERVATVINSARDADSGYMEVWKFREAIVTCLNLAAVANINNQALGGFKRFDVATDLDLRVLFNGKFLRAFNAVRSSKWFVDTLPPVPHVDENKDVAAAETEIQSKWPVVRSSLLSLQKRILGNASESFDTFVSRNVAEFNSVFAGLGADEILWLFPQKPSVASEQVESKEEKAVTDPLGEGAEPATENKTERPPASDSALAADVTIPVARGIVCGVLHDDIAAELRPYLWFKDMRNVTRDALKDFAKFASDPALVRAGLYMAHGIVDSHLARYSDPSALDACIKVFAKFSAADGKGESRTGANYVSFASAERVLYHIAVALTSSIEPAPDSVLMELISGLTESKTETLENLRTARLAFGSVGDVNTPESWKRRLAVRIWDLLVSICSGSLVDASDLQTTEFHLRLRRSFFCLTAVRQKLGANPLVSKASRTEKSGERPNGVDVTDTFSVAPIHFYASVHEMMKRRSLPGNTGIISSGSTAKRLYAYLSTMKRLYDWYGIDKIDTKDCVARHPTQMLLEQQCYYDGELEKDEHGKLKPRSSGMNVIEALLVDHVARFTEDTGSAIRLRVMSEVARTRLGLLFSSPAKWIRFHPSTTGLERFANPESKIIELTSSEFLGLAESPTGFSVHSDSKTVLFERGALARLASAIDRVFLSVEVAASRKDFDGAVGVLEEPLASPAERSFILDVASVVGSEMRSLVDESTLILGELNSEKVSTGDTCGIIHDESLEGILVKCLKAAARGDATEAKALVAGYSSVDTTVVALYKETRLPPDLQMTIDTALATVKEIAKLATAAESNLDEAEAAAIASRIVTRDVHATRSIARKLELMTDLIRAAQKQFGILRSAGLSIVSNRAVFGEYSSVIDNVRTAIIPVPGKKAGAPSGATSRALRSGMGDIHDPEISDHVRRLLLERALKSVKEAMAREISATGVFFSEVRGLSDNLVKLATSITEEAKTYGVYGINEIANPTYVSSNIAKVIVDFVKGAPLADLDFVNAIISEVPLPKAPPTGSLDTLLLYDKLLEISYTSDDWNDFSKKIDKWMIKAVLAASKTNLDLPLVSPKAYGTYVKTCPLAQICNFKTMFMAPIPGKIWKSIYSICTDPRSNPKRTMRENHEVQVGLASKVKIATKELKERLRGVDNSVLEGIFFLRQVVSWNRSSLPKEAKDQDVIARTTEWLKTVDRNARIAIEAFSRALSRIDHRVSDALQIVTNEDCVRTLQKVGLVYDRISSVTTEKDHRGMIDDVRRVIGAFTASQQSFLALVKPKFSQKDKWSWLMQSRVEMQRFVSGLIADETKLEMDSADFKEMVKTWPRGEIRDMIVRVRAANSDKKTAPEGTPLGLGEAAEATPVVESKLEQLLSAAEAELPPATESKTDTVQIALSAVSSDSIRRGLLLVQSGMKADEIAPAAGVDSVEVAVARLSSERRMHVIAQVKNLLSEEYNLDVGLDGIDAVITAVSGHSEGSLSDERIQRLAMTLMRNEDFVADTKTKAKIAWSSFRKETSTIKARLLCLRDSAPITGEELPSMVPGKGNRSLKRMQWIKLSELGMTDELLPVARLMSWREIGDSKWSYKQSGTIKPNHLSYMKVIREVALAVATNRAHMSYAQLTRETNALLSKKHAEFVGHWNLQYKRMRAAAYLFTRVDSETKRVLTPAWYSHISFPRITLCNDVLWNMIPGSGSNEDLLAIEKLRTDKKASTWTKTCTPVHLPSDESVERLIVSMPIFSEPEKVILDARARAVSRLIKLSIEMLAYAKNLHTSIEDDDDAEISGTEPDVEPEVEPDVEPEVEPDMESSAPDQLKLVAKIATIASLLRLGAIHLVGNTAVVPDANNEVAQSQVPDEKVVAEVAPEVYETDVKTTDDKKKINKKQSDSVNALLLYTGFDNENSSRVALPVMEWKRAASADGSSISDAGVAKIALACMLIAEAPITESKDSKSTREAVVGGFDNTAALIADSATKKAIEEWGFASRPGAKDHDLRQSCAALCARLLPFADALTVAVRTCDTFIGQSLEERKELLLQAQNVILGAQTCIWRFDEVAEHLVQGSRYHLGGEINDVILNDALSAISAIGLLDLADEMDDKVNADPKAIAYSKLMLPWIHEPYLALVQAHALRVSERRNERKTSKARRKSYMDKPLEERTEQLQSDKRLATEEKVRTTKEMEETEETLKKKLAIQASMELEIKMSGLDGKPPAANEELLAKIKEETAQLKTRKKKLKAALVDVDSRLSDIRAVIALTNEEQREAKLAAMTPEERKAAEEKEVKEIKFELSLRGDTRAPKAPLAEVAATADKEETTEESKAPIEGPDIGEAEPNTDEDEPSSDEENPLINDEDSEGDESS